MDRTEHAIQKRFNGVQMHCLVLLLKTTEHLLCH